MDSSYTPIPISFKIKSKMPPRFGLSVFSGDGVDEDEMEIVPTSNAAPPMDPSQLLRLREEGAYLAESGLMEEAICVWNKGLNHAPNDHFLLEMKAQALLSLGQLVKAAAVCIRVVEVAPTWPAGHLTLARIHRELGEVAFAISNYETVLKFDPSDAIASEELLEMRRMAQVMDIERCEHEGCLRRSTDKQESEIIRCFMNLTSRVKVT